MDTKELILNLCKGLERQLNFETGEDNKVELFSQQIWGGNPGGKERDWEVSITVNGRNMWTKQKAFNKGESAELMEEIISKNLLQNIFNHQLTKGQYI